MIVHCDTCKHHRMEKYPNVLYLICTKKNEYKSPLAVVSDCADYSPSGRTYL